MARFYYGGQAVIEGVMMRGKTSFAVAMRKADQSIYVYEEPLPERLRSKFFSLPFVRGILLLWETLVLGSRIMTLSANVASEEPGTESDNQATAKAEQAPANEDPTKMSGSMTFSLVISMTIAVAIFFVGPLVVTNLLGHWIGTGWLSLILEGVLRLALLIGYLLLIGRVPDIQCVFGYHGAEHKAINAMEHGDPLDVAHVRAATRVHTRCGTGFLLIVAVLSIFVFALVVTPSLPIKLLSRIVLVPIVASIAYELMRLGAANYRLRLVRWLLAPGLALQSLTTREPDDAMIECSIAALQRVLEKDQKAEAGAQEPAPLVTAQ
ncbi:hypothetical protein KSD_19980 [Ktedonobacter sp. SOSP1-85]|uniref:DUF1385 domain-containing protein n=1 Tax=Ktedonobacter sp. SOSP1-85 TaxID=2778367 RepID=UPI0019159CF5|nr:DUF1385 domain-containing protein [Ktedonobacter sp. SOSP1-85]GHO74227.1 hypothetical protein KSD_19980 [Ktedonobacter sp. SOSP1-85]